MNLKITFWKLLLHLPDANEFRLALSTQTQTIWVTFLTDSLNIEKTWHSENDNTPQPPRSHYDGRALSYNPGLQYPHLHGPVHTPENNRWDTPPV